MDIQSALLDVVENLKGELITSLKNANRVASGKTIDEIEAVASATSAQLLAPPYIYAAQNGRKPTSPGAPKGDPTLFEQIQAWCVAKGIDQKAAGAITEHIHKFGYEGTPGVIDDPLSDENIDRVMQGPLGEMASLFANALSDSLVLA